MGVYSRVPEGQKLIPEDILCQKRHNKDVYYVVGAGFSAGMGYPLTSDLLMRLWKRIDGFKDRPFRNAMEFVIRFHYPRFDRKKFSSFPNVEELLSQMVANDQLYDSSRQYEGHFKKEDLRALQRNFLLTIADWFHAISEKVNPSELSEPWLKNFRDRVMHENAVIISFNWDLILDELLFGSALEKRSYGFSKGPFEGPILLKPHGSLNWFESKPGRFIKDNRKLILLREDKSKDKSTDVYAFRKFRAPVWKSGRQYTPLIVPPVYLKNFEKPVFKKLWQNCTKYLSTAKKIFFLGYSMQAADFHAQFIMRCGFHNQIEGELLEDGNREEPTGAAKVIIINPDREAAQRTETIAGPKHKCQWISTPIADVSLDGL